MAEAKENKISVQDTIFRLHELVFVKMKGYTIWWPSRIIGIEGSRFTVFFLGDRGNV